MPINHDRMFLYIHIPRTAGHTIKKAIYAGGLDLEGFENKHILPSVLRPLIPSWDLYYKFAFTRNPFARLVSHYFHRRNNLHSPKYKKLGSFKNWFNAYVHKFKPLNNELEMMDFVGKVENIKVDFQTVCDKLKIENHLDFKENKSKHKHYRCYYDNHMIKKMNSIYEKELEKYNYEY